MIEEFKDRLHKLIHQALHGFGGNSQATVKIVDLILEFAVKMRATDLHIEPFENSLRFRYRIDGHLQELHENIPVKLADFLISRIKILARMDTAATFSPLDGAIKFADTEMRVASMPSFGAESITIRLLDSSRELHNLKELGFTADNEKIFREP